MEKDLVTLLAEAEANGRAKAEAEYKAEYEKAQSKRLQEEAIATAVKNAKEDARKEVEAEYKVARKTGYTGHKTAKVGDDSEGLDAFVHYLKSGQVAYELKATMVEGTAGLGGVTVPNAFYEQIQAKYVERSIVRQLGATVLQYSAMKVDFPIVSTGTNAAVYTAEAGAFDEQNPTLASLTIQLYKASRLIKVSTELLSDTQSNIESFLVDEASRKFGTLENNWFFNGNGSSQPYGLVTRAQLGVTAVSTGTIATGEMFDLLMALNDEARQEAKFVMHGNTYSHIVQKTGNPFQFVTTPQGNGKVGTQGYSLLGTPTYMASVMPTIATGAKVVLVGDFSRYMIIENGGLVVSRNPYLYQANGLVGLFFERRLGGDIPQPENLKYLAMA